MKFIIEDKVYDTEKAEEIISYLKKYPWKTTIGTLYTTREAILYKTQKGNWFSMIKRASGIFEAHKETQETVKSILRALGQVDIYNQHFGELEEA